MIPSRPSSGVTYNWTWFLNWTLTVLDIPRLQFLITIHSNTITNSQLQSMALSLFHSYRLQVTVTRTWSSRSAVPHQSRVPASNGRRSPSWVLGLSPFHSHSDSQCSLHLVEIYTLWSSPNNYLLELWPITDCC
jgi:hypothetical protein